MEKAYKFRIYPNAIQADKIQKIFGCCRYVWNHFLAKRINVYADSGKTFNYYDCAAELTMMKKKLQKDCAF